MDLFDTLTWAEILVKTTFLGTPTLTVPLHCLCFSLVEKLVHCAQLLCDCCPLRLGGDSGATARVLSAVQNDVYTTGVMMQSQKS
jgi:hypothetical protein